MVTKKDIVIDLAKEFGLTQVATKKIVQGTFDKIIAVIASEGRIELRNFGVFEVKHRKPRKARNPKTGEEVQVPDKYVVTFKPGRNMEEVVEKAYEDPAHRPAPSAEAGTDNDDDI